MRRILLQLDTDPHPSVFDRVVAVDADVNDLFSYGAITPEVVEPLVHGLMFTRKSQDLKSSAIFVGGSQVAAGEQVLKRVLKTFFGPVRVSVMMDSNGSNTTAAACVLAAERHLPLAEITALVLGGTGPVGCRVAQILASQGAQVCLASRSAEKAAEVARSLAATVPAERLVPLAMNDLATISRFGARLRLVVAAGAAGVTLATADQLQQLLALNNDTKVAIDVNAVPPAGIAGIEVMDRGVERNGWIGYGAIGVGGTKMKIHKAAIQKLFESNDQVLDTARIYELGKALGL